MTDEQLLKYMPWSAPGPPLEESSRRENAADLVRGLRRIMMLKASVVLVLSSSHLPFAEQE